MFKRVFLSIWLLTGALMVPVPAAHAQNVLTLDRILPEIRRSYPGSFSDAETVTAPNGQVIYRIKWIMPDGRVIWIEADARTGRIVGQSGGGQSGPAPGRNNRFLGN